MFRKPKRNFRQRVVKNDSDEENNDNDMETEESETSIKIIPDQQKNTKDKKKKDKSKSVLSFDHEEGKKRFFKRLAIKCAPFPLKNIYTQLQNSIVRNQ